MRYACIAVEGAGYWEALQAPGWTDAQLARFQQRWEAANILKGAAMTLEMERARGPLAFQMARASRDGAAQVMGDANIKSLPEIWEDFLLQPRDVPGEILNSYPRYWGWKWIWSYRDEQRYLEGIQNMIDRMREKQKRKPSQSSTGNFNAGVGEDTSATNSIDAAKAMLDGAAVMVPGALQAQTEAHIVTTAIALERFRLAHHTYPDALTKLVPEFIKSVPIDCMDGHQLRYRPNADGTFLLYSVGEDGVDNGGDPTPVKGFGPSAFRGRD